MSNSKGSQFLRSNVLGLVAIFIAATGTAVVAEAQNATTAKVTDAKFKKLKKRVAALEGRVNAPVTGDLTGTLPNLQLAQNSVTTNEIAANAVTTVKIADNAVATAKIADNAVGTAKIADAAVSTAKIAGGAITGAKLGGVRVAQNTTTDVTSGTGVQEPQTCTGTERVLSGGGFWSGSLSQNATLKASAPVGGGTIGWQAQGFNLSGDNTLDFTGYALCLQ